MYSLEGCRSTIELRPLRGWVLGGGRHLVCVASTTHGHASRFEFIACMTRRRYGRDVPGGFVEGVVGRAGFEPAKALPSDLQSDPFGRSGTSPRDKDPSVIQCARKRLDDQADLDSDAGCRYQCRPPRELSPTGALLPCHPVRVPL